jgi:uncharacterized protein YjbI with pentapeptide repeats
VAQQGQSRGRQVLWLGVAGALLIVAILVGYRYGITLWDWIKLLIVPAVIAGGGYWFNRQQRERELEIAQQQREQELEIAQRRTQDEALQAYLDGMSQLLTDKDRPLHRSPPGDRLRTVARARTLTVLPRLDSDHKARAVQFLYESGLVDTEQRIVDLTGANLRGAALRWVTLYWADLRWVNLSEADLSKADLRWATLYGANLRGATLNEADLSGATLYGATLRGATLYGADLSGANLNEADLSGVTLSGANLRGARGITNEQLDQQAWALVGATMPNGQKYEEWLNDRASRNKDAGGG